MRTHGDPAPWFRLMVLPAVVAPFLLAGGPSGFTPPLRAAGAEPPPTEASLPTSSTPPPAGNGAPRGATGVDLAAFGYVEEEFLVTGKANVYEYDPGGAVVVKTSDMGYTTRILVRRPANPEQFSGTVHVETSHPLYGIDFVWSRVIDYVLETADAFVSIATRRSTGPGGSSAIEAMLDMPIARYFSNAPASGGGAFRMDGAQEHFSPDELGLLYEGHDGYVREVDRRASELEQDGWLLPANAEELRMEAARFDGF